MCAPYPCEAHLDLRADGCLARLRVLDAWTHHLPTIAAQACSCPVPIAKWLSSRGLPFAYNCDSSPQRGSCNLDLFLAVRLERKGLSSLDVVQRVNSSPDDVASKGTSGAPRPLPLPPSYPHHFTISLRKQRPSSSPTHLNLPSHTPRKA